MNKKQVRKQIDLLSSELTGVFGIGGSSNNDIDLVYLATKIEFDKLVVFKKLLEEKTQRKVSICPLLQWQVEYPTTWGSKVATMAFKKEIDSIELDISLEELQRIVKANAICFANTMSKELAGGKISKDKAIELLLQEVLILGG